MVERLMQTRLMQHRWTKRLVALATLYADKRANRSAAELSYFLTMSVFPMLICVTWLLGTLRLDLLALFALYEHLLPASIVAIFTEYLTYIGQAQSPAMLLTGLIATVTTSSMAFDSLLGTLREVYGCPERRGLLRRVFSVLTSAVFLLLVYACAIVVVAGGWLLEFLSRYFPLEVFLSGPLWALLRFGILFVVLFVMLHGLYSAASHQCSPRHSSLPGAAFGSSALVVVSGVFSGFISLSTRYSVIYGSLASVIILMTWLYLCANIVILGAMAGVVLARPD